MTGRTEDPASPTGQDLRGALRRAAGAPASPLDPADLQRRVDHRRRRARRRLAGGGVLAVAVLVGGASWATASRGGDGDSSGVLSSDSGTESDAGWRRIGDLPLSPRSDAGIFWTGSEVLVIGGTTDPPCPPNASCVAGDPPRRDGAIHDLDTGASRPIADAPVPLLSPQGTVVDGQLYLVGESYPAPVDETPPEPYFLRYDPEADEWTELTPPSLPGWRRLVADGSRLVAYLGSHEAGDEPDVAWDPATETWTPLSRDPLAPSFDRSLVAVDGDLYAFGKDLVPNPGSEGPSFLRGAVLTGGVWRELPPSGSIGYGGVATDGVIVSPGIGGADGGEVGNWGRSYPYRWLFDTAAQRWEDSPEPPVGDPGLGPWVAGSGRVVAGGSVFDVRTRTWSDLDLPPELQRQGAAATWAGDRLVAFGGTTVEGDDFQGATFHADLWQWVPSD